MVSRSQLPPPASNTSHPNPPINTYQPHRTPQLRRMHRSQNRALDSDSQLLYWLAASGSLDRSPRRSGPKRLGSERCSTALTVPSLAEAFTAVPHPRQGRCLSTLVICAPASSLQAGHSIMSCSRAQAPAIFFQHAAAAAAQRSRQRRQATPRWRSELLRIQKLLDLVHAVRKPGWPLAR